MIVVSLSGPKTTSDLPTTSEPARAGDPDLICTRNHGICLVLELQERRMVGVAKPSSEQVGVQCETDDDLLSWWHVREAELVAKPGEKEDDVEVLHPLAQLFRKMWIVGVKSDIHDINGQGRYALPHWLRIHGRRRQSSHVQEARRL